MNNQWSKKVKQKLQEKNGEHKNIRGILFELSKTDGFVLKPIVIIGFFKNWLIKNHKSTMNSQQARNLAEVYSTLCHIYNIAAEKYKIENAFAVSPAVWNKLCIGQSALTSSISLLKEMGLVSFYNHYPKNQSNQRKRYYKLNRQMLEFFIRQSTKTQTVDELDFDNWEEFKGKKKKIERIAQVSKDTPTVKQDEADLNDYDDLNSMLDDGWYFC